MFVAVVNKNIVNVLRRLEMIFCGQTNANDSVEGKERDRSNDDVDVF